MNKNISRLLRLDGESIQGASVFSAPKQIKIASK